MATTAECGWDTLLEDDVGERVPFQYHVLHEIMPFVADSTQAYFQAVEYCPQVLESETPHEMYLCFCQQDAHTAARRLASYWATRFSIFGADQAFLPLPLALTSSEWKFMQTGGLALLPPSRNSQRSVLMIDKLKIEESDLLMTSEPQQTQAIRKRCLFYLFHLMQHQSREFDVLIPVDYMSDILLSAGLNANEEDLVRLALEFLSGSGGGMCLQERDARLHLLVANAPTNAQERETNLWWSSVISNLPTAAVSAAVEVYVHIGDCAAILSSLHRQGFDPRTLPDTVGGSWTYERDWSGFVAKQFSSDHGTPYEDNQDAAASNQIGRPRAAAPDMSIPMPAGLIPAAFLNHPVHEAIDFVADSASWDAYWRAVQLCSEVVHDETPHDKFHSFADYNPWAAAERLATYWSIRAEVFGEDAFVPLRVALRPEDKPLIFRGVSSLPPPIDDPESGASRAVLFMDKSIHQAPPPRTGYQRRFRASFYKFHLMMEEATEFVIVVRINNSFIGFFQTDRMWINFFQKLETEAMCLKFPSHLHVVSVNPPSGFSSALVMQMFVVKMISRISSWFKLMPRTLHMGNLSEVAASLQKHGFKQRDIPMRCGGWWDGSKPDWMKRFRPGIRLDECYKVDCRPTRVRPAANSAISTDAMHHLEAEASVPKRFRQGCEAQPRSQATPQPRLQSPTPERLAGATGTSSWSPLLDIEPLPIRELGFVIDCSATREELSLSNAPLRDRSCATFPPEPTEDCLVLPANLFTFQNGADGSFPAAILAPSSNQQFSGCSAARHLDAFPNTPLPQQLHYDTSTTAPPSWDVKSKAGSMMPCLENSGTDLSRSPSRAIAVSPSQKQSGHILDKLAANHDDIVRSVEDILAARRDLRRKKFNAWSRKRKAERGRKPQAKHKIAEATTRNAASAIF